MFDDHTINRDWLIDQSVGQLDIAVVGSGIAGLGAAWLLSRRHRVTLFEREARVGGHSNTVDAPGPDGPAPVDTGFIVYNTATYPNLIALFEHLNVPSAKSEMSFGVSIGGGAYEYAGGNLAGLFGQPANILRACHWRMIADILRFFREAPTLLARDGGEEQTLGEYLVANKYSEAFVARHILPMAAAIWSTPAAEVMAFPAVAFVRFFANHGLLQVANRPAWRTVRGGSREYVRRILADMNGRISVGNRVTAIERTLDGVVVTHGNASEKFDACVIATHADEALALLRDPDEPERNMLGAFAYAANRAVLHKDASFMPRRKSVWSCWNYVGAGDRAENGLSLTYWMNKLQPLSTKENLFVTLNPARAIAPGQEIAAFDYSHPLFNKAALNAQRELWGLQGRRRTWFCGSYFGYGFHEDALQAGLAAAEDIGGVRRPWTVPDESGRIHRLARDDRALAPVVA